METPLTPLDFLTRARRLFPRRVGVVDGERRFTYGEFAARCDRLAWALRDELGVRPGDRVAWLCGNTHELLEAYYGVLLAGAVLLPLNIRLAPAEARFVLDDSGAAVLFRHPDQPDVGHRVPNVVLGPEHEALLERGAGPPLPGGAGGRDERSGDLLHERDDRRPQGRGAHPPGPLPPRRALGPDRRPSPATT